jgi:hypothetical protein
MAKDPAFLFYYQDFLVGTEFMPNDEVGAYIRILCHMADKGKLSKEDMQSICRGYAFTKRLQSKFLVDEEGLFYNQRLSLEVEKRKFYSESRRNNAKAYAKHMEDENENINKDKFLFFKDSDFLKTWGDFLEMRKKIRKPATDRAKDLILKKLHKDDIKMAMARLEQSIVNGWQDVYPLKEAKQSGTQQSQVRHDPKPNKSCTNCNGTGKFLVNGKESQCWCVS